MNAEAERRLAEAADAIMSSVAALAETLDGLNDSRLGAESVQVRQQAMSSVLSRGEQAVRRLEEALKKATIAAAATRVGGAYSRYKEAHSALADAQAYMSMVRDADGTPAKLEKLRSAYAALERALDVAQSFVFVE